MSVIASSSARARSRRCFSVGKSRRGLMEERVRRGDRSTLVSSHSGTSRSAPGNESSLGNLR